MEIPTFNNQLQVLNISDCDSIARWPAPPCSSHGTCVKVNNTESLGETLACYCESGYHAEGDSLFDIVPGYDGVYGDCDISSNEIVILWGVCSGLALVGVVLLARLFLIKKNLLKKTSFKELIMTRQLRVILLSILSFIFFEVVAGFKIFDAKKYAVGRSWPVTIIQLSATFLILIAQFESSIFLLESSTNPFTEEEHSSTGFQNAAKKLKNSLRRIGNQKYFLFVGNVGLGIPTIVMIFMPQNWEILHIISLSAYMLLHTVLKATKRHHTNNMNKVLEFLKERQKDNSYYLSEIEVLQTRLKLQNAEEVGEMVIQMTISLMFVVWPLLRHKMPYYNPIALIIGLCFLCIASSRESSSILKQRRARLLTVSSSSKEREQST